MAKVLFADSISSSLLTEATNLFDFVPSFLAVPFVATSYAGSVASSLLMEATNLYLEQPSWAGLLQLPFYFQAESPRHSWQKISNTTSFGKNNSLVACTSGDRVN
jgi:hypothetical protein